MASPEELVPELQTLAAYLRTREQSSGCNGETVASNMVASFATKVSACRRFDASAALALCNALVASGLRQPLADVIQAAIDNRVAGNASTGQQGAKHHPQLLASQLVCYLTAKDWAVLDDTGAGVTTKMLAIIHRLLRLGLRYPQEQTVRWAVALAVVAWIGPSGSYPSYASVFTLVQDFKASIAAGRRPWPHAHLVRYPPSPEQLPPEVFAAAYDPDDPPVQRMVCRLASTAENHVPLRSSSNLLKNAASAASSSSSSGAVTWDQLRALMAGQMPSPGIHVLQRMPMQRSMSLSAIADSPHADVQGSPEAPRTIAALALADVPPLGSPGAPHGSVVGSPIPQPMESVALGPMPVQPSAPPASAPEDDRIPTERFEEMALERLLNRSEKRRKTTSEAEPVVVMMRPASASSAVVMKRPASASSAVSEDDIVAEVLAGLDAQKPRPTFVSSAYHKTKTRAAKAGFAPDAAKATARVAFQRAGALWDESV